MHLLLCILLHVALSAATLWNRTIDDTNGDSASGQLPVYSPALNFSLNSNCPTCSVRLDPTKVLDGTWHDSSQLDNGPPVSISLSFNGTAIYLFCVLANALGDATTNSDFAFSLDGSPHGTFTHEPSTSPDYTYGANVFSVNGLEQRPHELVLTTDNSAGTLLLFDYAIYTFDDGVVQTTTTVTTKTPAVPPSVQPSSTTRSNAGRSSISVPFTSSAASSRSTSSSIASTTPTQLFITPSTTSSPSLSATSSQGPSSVVSGLSAPKQRLNLAVILPATIVPILFVVCVAAWLYRRHARYRQEVEATRAHPPEPAWVDFSDLDAQSPARALREKAGTRRPVSGSPPTYRSDVPA